MDLTKIRSYQYMLAWVDASIEAGILKLIGEWTVLDELTGFRISYYVYRRSTAIIVIRESGLDFTRHIWSMFSVSIAAPNAAVVDMAKRRIS